jgi:hypothetical protein
MEKTGPFESHPAEKLLDAPLPPQVATELRGTLFAQTTRVLRRRRRLKQIAYIAGLVGCYLLGAATMLLGMARIHREAPAALEVVEAITGNAGSVHSISPRDPDSPIPASVLERMAQSCEGNRSDFYRQAGDRYLADGDYGSAVHCYSRSLDAGCEKDLVVSMDDNWLLIQLKIARREEKVNAKSAG